MTDRLPKLSPDDVEIAVTAWALRIVSVVMLGIGFALGRWY